MAAKTITAENVGQQLPAPRRREGGKNCDNCRLLLFSQRGGFLGSHTVVN